MAAWIYNEDEFQEISYQLIPEGVYRVRIEKAEEVISRNGKDMIKLTLAVSGYNSKLWNNIILDDSTAETRKWTNQRLGTVFSSFGISDHTMDIKAWEGKVGGARVRHKKDLNGIDRAEVYYFLYRKDVEQLPPWQEGTSKGTINPEMIDVERQPFYGDPAAAVQAGNITLNPNNIPF